MFEAALQGLMELFTLTNTMLMTFGVVVGLGLGALPGIGGLVTLALLLPFVYGMDPVRGFAFLLGAHGAVYFGGSITAILLNTPGTPESAATTFDGYPMTQKGHGKMALGISATASSIGGLFGVIVMVVAIPLLRVIMMSVGVAEFFLLAVTGITVIGMVNAETRIKGLASGALGLLLSFVGYDPVSGVNRFTFDNPNLYDGFESAPVLIGLFALAEMIKLFRSSSTIATTTELGESETTVWDGVRETLKRWPLVLRCSAIGAWIGLIPGVGGSVANFLAYGHAQQSSDHPELFGTGTIEGIIAPEASNNAKEGGSIVPTMAFGIPGAAAMAVLLGAFYILGVNPGPEMLTTNLHVVFSMTWTVAFSAIIASIIGLATVKYYIKITVVQPKYMVPFIIIISLIGAFATRYSFLDVVIASAFGLFGYFFKRYGFSPASLVVGLLLGKIAERNLSLTQQIYGWSFLLRPFSIVLVLCLVLMILWPYLKKIRKGKNEDVESAKEKAPVKVRRGEFLFELLMMLGVAGYLIVALGYNPRARLSPLVIGSVALVLLVWQSIKKYRQVKNSAGERVEAEEEYAEKNRRFIGSIIVIALVILGSYLIGIIPATSIALFLYFLFYIKLHFLKSFAIGALMWVFLFEVFTVLLKIHFPEGILIRMIFG